MQKQSEARVTVSGEVMKIEPFKFARRDGSAVEGHEVTLLQRPKQGDSRAQPMRVTVAVWNGQMKDVKAGAPATLECVAALRTGVDKTGRPYPPRLTLNAY